MKARPRIPPEKDRRDRGPPPEQWNVKAVSPLATSALRNCCFNCRAGQSHGDNARSERSPTLAAQLHLPAHGLFWANLRVQLHLPPLDLAWDPV